MAATRRFSMIVVADPRYISGRLTTIIEDVLAREPVPVAHLPPAAAHPLAWSSCATEVVVMQGLLDTPGGDGADALVDRQCLAQMRGGLAGVAVLQLALTEPFQGACLRSRAMASASV
jgi:hypothetical protein